MRLDHTVDVAVFTGRALLCVYAFWLDIFCKAVNNADMSTRSELYITPISLQ